MRTERLTRETWIRTAYRAFEAGGVEALQVEPLCRSLGVSKGSFYWHFADRRELLDYVLDHWSQQSHWFRLDAERRRPADARLEHLADRFAAAAGQRADRAMMLWARRDPRVAPRIRRVLRRRLRYVAALLRLHGLPAGEAAWRAQVISYAYMGWLDRAGTAGVSVRAARGWMRRLTTLALSPQSTHRVAHPRSGSTAASARRRPR